MPPVPMDGPESRASEIREETTEKGVWPGSVPTPCKVRGASSEMGPRVDGIEAPAVLTG
jgi:hypothetical protein